MTDAVRPRNSLSSDSCWRARRTEQITVVRRWGLRYLPATKTATVTDLGPNDHDIRILSSLVETTLDSVDGYEEAAKDAVHAGYRNLFLRRATERRQVVIDLQSQIRALGGTPDDDGSVLAAGHRVFVTLRDSLSKGNACIVKEVERGEDYITTKYEEALEDDDLSVSIRTALVHAYASVKSGHDQMKRLRSG
jgi:uncharacterized protein (TIGR02284 family)